MGREWRSLGNRAAGGIPLYRAMTFFRSFIPNPWRSSALRPIPRKSGAAPSATSRTTAIPASFTRVMHTPSPPIEIKRNEDHIEINYEFMDIRRRVPLDPTQTLENAPFTVAEHPHMGRSIGRYDGETLVIETAGQQAGVLDTLGIAGLPQSGEMRTEERFLADGDNLKVVVTHYDPVNYSEPLVVRYEFIRLDSEILEWGCTVDEASYERFSDIPQ